MAGYSTVCGAKNLCAKKNLQWSRRFGLKKKIPRLFVRTKIFLFSLPNEDFVLLSGQRIVVGFSIHVFSRKTCMFSRES